MFNVESLDFFSLTPRESKCYHTYANFTRSLKEIERKKEHKDWKEKAEFSLFIQLHDCLCTYSKLFLCTGNKQLENEILKNNI